MLLLEDAQHFVRGPDWTWYILFYFFLGGLSGGSYAIATLLRLTGRGDEPAARVGYYVSFAALLPCPVLLALDLGQPLRFWHMLVNTTPGERGSGLQVLVADVGGGLGARDLRRLLPPCRSSRRWCVTGELRMSLAERAVRLLDGAFGRLFAIVGAVFGLFIAGYTGVLLAVSNQPVWSDTWALGALFLASGLSGSAALMGWLVHNRADARDSAAGLVRSERFFQVLELALIGLFVVTLIPAGNGVLQRAFGFPWYLLWAVALLGIASGLRAPGAARPADMPGEGAVAVRTTRAVATWSVVAGPHRRAGVARRGDLQRPVTACRPSSCAAGPSPLGQVLEQRHDDLAGGAERLPRLTGREGLRQPGQYADGAIHRRREQHDVRGEPDQPTGPYGRRDLGAPAGPGRRARRRRAPRSRRGQPLLQGPQRRRARSARACRASHRARSLHCGRSRAGSAARAPDARPAARAPCGPPRRSSGGADGSAARRATSVVSRSRSELASSGATSQSATRAATGGRTPAARSVPSRTMPRRRSSLSPSGASG